MHVLGAAHCALAVQVGRQAPLNARSLGAHESALPFELVGSPGADRHAASRSPMPVANGTTYFRIGCLGEGRRREGTLSAPPTDECPARAGWDREIVIGASGSDF